MQDFDRLGVFYLGRAYDLENKKSQSQLILYESKDLVTHAVCVGMTGSGKTGLCIGLLEEAAIDGIPALIIDPKGDLSNLLLTFPHLRTDDFLPWVDPKDAQKKGLSRGDHAQEEAIKWQTGLKSWHQDGGRIAKLKDSAEFAIYTPGSNSGLPISILKSFSAPPQPIIGDSEQFRERINSTATSLLSLVGIEADPLQSREHILLANILAHAWRQSQDLDLAKLIGQIQMPPVTKIGILDLESFFPSKARYSLAMRFNNLLGAPGFSVWLEGQALDIDQLLFTQTGKPRMAILSIAHLSDAERMFFVTLLLSQTISWMRAQSGTTSLRALVYMDEVFGYLPPVKNPPSKAPLLTLLKQARAFGVGMVLATQNPVDLDYKALGNAGTWFIGRLQTDQDMARVLDGLEGALANAEKPFDRTRLEQIISGLGSRIFFMNNVHEEAPEIFETRWTLSYLRGPLTRAQIKTLMDPQKEVSQSPPQRSQGDESSASVGEEPLRAVRDICNQPPILPPEVSQFFIPIRSSQPNKSSLLYLPRLIGVGSIQYVHAKPRLDMSRDVVIFVPFVDSPISLDWENAEEIEIDLVDLERNPEGPAEYGPLPAKATNVSNYKKWERKFRSWMYRTQSLQLWESPVLNIVSRPDESERDFCIRLQQLSHEQRDRETQTLRKKYSPRLATLEDRMRRAQQAVEREAEQAKHQKLQTAISFGATILSAFLGRKVVSRSSLGRATTAIRGVGRSMKEAQDVARAGETVEALQQRLGDLEGQFEEEASRLAAKWDHAGESFETVTVRPKKTNITTHLVTLVWVPYWKHDNGEILSSWK